MAGFVSALILPTTSADRDPNVDTSLGNIVTRAILFLAPLLPLLATALCKDRVARALDLGLLYPAAAPMSIFGCLGIAKAGFIALFASIDRDVFDGPALLRDAGIRPSGIGELLLHVKENKQNLYLGEDRLRTILSKKKVRSVDVNLKSPDLLEWNGRLFVWTALLSMLGILPYVPLFIYSLSAKPFHETWLYPILRISGSAIVAISIQILFQLRLLEEVYYRLRFLAADTYLKDAGISLPSFWDHNQRSKDTFAELERWIADPNRQVGYPQHRELTEADAIKVLHCIDSLSSFDFTSHTREANGSARRFRLSQYASTIILWLTQLLLLFGFACTILGYVGCFGVVIASGSAGVWWGPLFWLVCEGALLLVRMVVWALNPKWDDPRSPIVLEKFGDTVNAGDQNKCSYGVGWGLKSVTADDMHALIIGINKYPPRTGRGLTNLSGALPDAKKIKRYLQETLLVPCNQICTLYDQEATKERIVEELKGLRHRGSVAQNAPIVIYYAGHSIVEDRNAYLVPYPPNVQKKDQEAEEADMLAYSEIVDLLKHIGDEKTENIVFIIDSCHAGALGRNARFSDDLSIGHSSHILLASSSEDQQAHETDDGKGGLFTAALLEVLNHAEDSGDLKEMTYQVLLDMIRMRFHQEKVYAILPDGTMRPEPYDTFQSVRCTTIHQKRLLFDGLFSRKRDDKSIDPLITVRYTD